MRGDDNKCETLRLKGLDRSHKALTRLSSHTDKPPTMSSPEWLKN
jgi:hypothetical protein